MFMRFANQRLMDFQQFRPRSRTRASSIADMIRFQAQRGDFGPVTDIERGSWKEQLAMIRDAGRRAL